MLADDQICGGLKFQQFLCFLNPADLLVKHTIMTLNIIVLRKKLSSDSYCNF